MNSFKKFYYSKVGFTITSVLVIILLLPMVSGWVSTTYGNVISTIYSIVWFAVYVMHIVLQFVGAMKYMEEVLKDCFE